jgi:hypothetical protein
MSLLPESPGGETGGPLVPLLFNFVADCLTRMVVRAQENNRVVGLVSNLIPKGIAIIQYADDTIMCLGADENQARYMKLLLYIYEQLSGLKINFEKSKILSIGGDNDMDNSFAEIFNCQVGLFPVKYLGVSISAKRMRVIDCERI